MKTLDHKSKNKKLTPQRKEFIRQYWLCRCDGKAAAIASGYSEKTAHAQAHNLLQDPAVAREIAKEGARVKKRYESQLDCAMEELFHCVTRKGTDLVDKETGLMLPLHAMPERVNAAMDGYEEESFVDKAGNLHVKKKVKLVSKATAIDMALKVQGAYAPEKSEVNQKTTVDFSNLYGKPEGALEPDVIELLPEEVED